MLAQRPAPMQRELPENVTNIAYRLMRSRDIPVDNLGYASKFTRSMQYTYWGCRTNDGNRTVILLHPCFANSSARWRPIPEPAPVISAALPSTFMIAAAPSEWSTLQSSSRRVHDAYAGGSVALSQMTNVHLVTAAARIRTHVQT